MCCQNWLTSPDLYFYRWAARVKAGTLQQMGIPRYLLRRYLEGWTWPGAQTLLKMSLASGLRPGEVAEVLLRAQERRGKRVEEKREKKGVRRGLE